MMNIAFRESAKSKIRVMEWCTRFRDGGKDIEDEKQIGCITTSIAYGNMDKFKMQMMNYHYNWRTPCIILGYYWEKFFEQNQYPVETPSSIFAGYGPCDIFCLEN